MMHILVSDYLFIIHYLVHRAPEEAACKDSFNDFKERFEGQMSEVQKLISEEERYIADKHSLVSNLVAQIKNFLN